MHRRHRVPPAANSAPEKLSSDSPSPPRTAGVPASTPASSHRLGRSIPGLKHLGRWYRCCQEQIADAFRSIGFPRLTGFLISFAIHLVLLLILALVVQMTSGKRSSLLTLTVVDMYEEELHPIEMEIRDVAPHDLSSSPFAAPSEQLMQEARKPEAPEIASPWAAPDFSSAMPVAGLHSAVPWELPEASRLLMEVAASGGGLEGRTPEMRARLLAEYGGTAASEAAVAAGLAWLAAHQRESGGWRFNHQQGPCNGRCEHPGRIGSSTGATALALLPFLGAGQTHRSGQYQEVVEQGLYYLQSRMLDTPYGGDFQEGTMYAQGLAAIALCEAYALTGDQGLRPVAQKAIDYICYAQHPGGGWRYYPGQPGDTTVTGWQLMALKSARLAGLDVPSPTWQRTHHYFDSVQTADGALYGYLKPEKAPTPTAVGLLSRMYLGWPRDDDRLRRGVEYLAVLGPSDHDMYFNYYATQVLHHHAGAPWGPWNRRLREFLIETQHQQGHPRGSWYFVDKHGTLGGRLYATAICTMTLEVYYRYLPLYGDRVLEQ